MNLLRFDPNNIELVTKYHLTTLVSQILHHTLILQCSATLLHGNSVTVILDPLIDAANHLVKDWTAKELRTS